uniref:Membrane spanning 4-domains A13 n=1 Tax=Saimiri boliviensis boliviensis TaxID=39432 RepID=A0A2K6TXN9_SAIBB
MIGVFHVFMWYFLLVLYMGQIKGVFGTYEPITYKTGCTLWGTFFQRHEGDATSVPEEAESSF